MLQILLVDDDDHFAGMVQCVLEQAGHQVFRAPNGKKALSLFNPDTINLVLTDIVMPDMEGIELITRLRKAHPAVKIIAMSGGSVNSNKVYLPSAKLLGADCTLEKPFSNDQLLTAIHCPGNSALSEDLAC